MDKFIKYLLSLRALNLFVNYSKAHSNTANLKGDQISTSDRERARLEKVIETIKWKVAVMKEERQFEINKGGT